MCSSRALALLLLAVCACAQPRPPSVPAPGPEVRELPDYALPKVVVADPAQVAKQDGIAYRTLTRADFRADQPPFSVPTDGPQLGAYTCAYVSTPVNLKVDVRQSAPGEPFVARLPPASFHASMNRDCSWWNPAPVGLPESYLLQHEQIHFAIVELVARDLARRGAALVATGSTPQDAGAELQRRLEALTRTAMEAAVERSKRFDLDTSGRHAPQQQQRWFDEVTAELAR